MALRCQVAPSVSIVCSNGVLGSLAIAPHRRVRGRRSHADKISTAPFSLCVFGILGRGTTWRHTPRKSTRRRRWTGVASSVIKTRKRLLEQKGISTMPAMISAASVGSTSGRRTFVHIPNWRGSSRRGTTVGVKTKPGELQGPLPVRERKSEHKEFECQPERFRTSEEAQGDRA